VFGGRRPINPNRLAQSFDLNLDLSGGYDRDPNSLPTDPTIITTDAGWAAGQGLLSTNYRLGHARRSLDTRARGTMNYQGNAHIPLYGGGLSVNGVSRFGRRAVNQLQVSADASYEPGWVFGAVNPALPTGNEPPPLDVAPVMGIAEQRWFTTSGTSGYQHHWNTRHQSQIQIGLGRVRPIGDVGLNSEWQNGTVSQSWLVGSGFDLMGSYRFDRSHETVQATASEPVQYQSAAVGFRIAKRFSPLRRLTFSLMGGGTQILPGPGSSADDEVIHPSVSTSVEFVASRNWTLSVSASRQVTVLSGVSAHPLNNDNVAFSLSGTVGRRLRLALTGSYMQGTTLTPSATSSGSTGGGGNLSIRYGLRRWIGTYATYSFYQHRLQSDLQAAAGIPTVYDRHSARAGFTLWLPLYGTF
jgi:hypothetical protein